MKLKSVVTISAAYNREMPDHYKIKLKEHEAARASLESLKLFPNAFDIVTGVVDKPMHSVLSFLWDYKIQVNMEEEQLIKIIQFVLTDFVAKCNRPHIFQPKSERTFWIDRIIPIFQPMGLVGFGWCELNPESYTESTIEKDSWKRGPLRNVDGLGYLNADMIFMEASSGQKDRDLMHTKDDTLKNIRGSIYTLETSLRRYPDA